jgi:hypothetical protein
MTSLSGTNTCTHMITLCTSFNKNAELTLIKLIIFEERDLNVPPLLVTEAIKFKQSLSNFTNSRCSSSQLQQSYNKKHLLHLLMHDFVIFPPFQSIFKQYPLLLMSKIITDFVKHAFFSFFHKVNFKCAFHYSQHMVTICEMLSARSSLL